MRPQRREAGGAGDGVPPRVRGCGSRRANPEQVEKLAARAQALAEGWDRPADAPDPDDIPDEIPDDSYVDHSNDVYAE